MENLDVWHYAEHGQPQGPVSVEEIKTLIHGGRILPSSPVWTEGFADWQPAGETMLVSFFAPVSPSEDIPVASQFASFRVRLGAILIDVVIGNIFAFVVVISIFFLINLIGFHLFVGPNAAQQAETLGQWLGMLSFLGYFGILNSSRWQCTIGKRMLGIYIVRADRRRMGFWFGVGRYLAYIVSALPLGIGFLMPLWTNDRQALHDIICGTRVVYGRI